jgi:hypothetical protein
MRRLLPFLLSLLLAAFAGPAARAMDFHVVDDILVLSGPVVDSDLRRLRDELAAHPPVKLVLLHDSPGGDLWTGYQLANRIRDEGLDTAVSGKCESACALVFLAGRARSFTDGRAPNHTMVGLHGAHAPDTGRALTEFAPRMAFMIRTMTGRRYPDDLLQRTVYPVDPEDMVYAFHPAAYAADAPGRGVMQCMKQPDAAFRCSMLRGLDALSIGVITNPEVLRLPDDVRRLLRQLS